MIKKNKLSSALLTAMISSIVLAACSQGVATEWKSNIKVILTVDDNFDDSKVPNFLNAWTTEAERLRLADSSLKNLPSFKINFFSKVSDYKVISDDITVHKADLGFVNSAIAYQNQKNYQVRIQALTDAFNADPDYSEYDVVTKGQNLVATAKKLSDQFNKTPYQQWTDEKQFWTNNRYDFLYRLNDPSLNPTSTAENTQPQAKTTTKHSYKKINYYRGMIMMWGDSNKRTVIKKAWDEQNWTSFRDFGILTGSASSIGKSLLQQNLLKLHFNKPENSFGITLADEKLKSPNSFTVGKGQNIGTKTLEKYHIAFDDEASYAWTNNKDSTGKTITSNFNPGTDNDKKIEILSVTNPNLYDAGIFSKTVDSRQVKLIAEALINLSNKGDDQYGPDVGYNGYKYIENLESEFNSFMKWMN